jgi:hypothetical protein
VLEKLRAALADKVAREERIVSRDKQVGREGVLRGKGGWVGGTGAHLVSIFTPL